MSILIDLAGSDTTIPDGVVKNFEALPTNFAIDWRETDEQSVSKQKGSKEISMKNMKTPIDIPETITVGIVPIKDMYASMTVSPASKLPVTSGYQVRIKSNMVAKITDTEDALNPKYTQVFTSVILGIPDTPHITAGHVMYCLQRTLSALANTGSASNDRITELMQNIIKPRDLD